MAEVGSALRTSHKNINTDGKYFIFKENIELKSIQAKEKCFPK